MPAALAPSQSFLNQELVDAALARPEPSVALTNTKRTPAARTDFHLMATPPSWLWADTSTPRNVPDGAASAPGASANIASVDNVTDTDTNSTPVGRRRATLAMWRSPLRRCALVRLEAGEIDRMWSVHRRSVIGPPGGSHRRPPSTAHPGR